MYYSLENGTVDTAVMNNWDIAFTTEIYSVSILANTASDVELYTYTEGDIDDWATMDTTGMTWTRMFNSLETFEEGAFSFNALGHPDYGWGIYGGMGLITGDSLFVIKTIAGVYKKLSIIRKVFIENRWEFKYANLDGTDEQFLTINAGKYDTKNYIYYSIDSQAIVNRGPATADWDSEKKEYQDSTYYKLYFTGFTGMSEGKYTFMQEELLSVSTDMPGTIQFLEVYPNPASDFVNVVFDREGETSMQIIDMTGRIVNSITCYAGGFSSLRLDISALNSGLYFIKVGTGNEAAGYSGSSKNSQITGCWKELVKREFAAILLILVTLCPSAISVRRIRKQVNSSTM